MKDFLSMRFKTFESFTEINIGDYVVIEDTYAGTACWHNTYGIVVDTGYFDYTNINRKAPKKDLYLIHHLCELTPEQKKNIEEANTSSIISTTNSYQKEKYDSWVCDDYVIKFNTKREFDNAVEKIEYQKNIKRYNL
jgi:hypothetical protein